MAGYLSGLEEIIQNIQDEVDKLEEKSVEGLHKALAYVKDEASKRAPVDTGDLRGSGDVQIEGEVGTVSFNTPYAAAQHEHVEYNHPLGGQAKYLESVLVEDKDKILHMIAGEDIE